MKKALIWKAVSGRPGGLFEMPKMQFELDSRPEILRLLGILYDALG